MDQLGLVVKYSIFQNILAALPNYVFILVEI